MKGFKGLTFKSFKVDCVRLNGLKVQWFKGSKVRLRKVCGIWS